MEDAVTVVKFLIENLYELTALEFLQEINSQVVGIRKAENDHIERNNGDVSEAKRLLMEHLTSRYQLTEKDGREIPHVETLRKRDEEISLLEYKLRVSEEDVANLQLKAEAQKKQDTEESDDGTGAEDGRRDGITSLSEKDTIALNGTVMDFLISSGYRLTAITFSDEVQSNLPGGESKSSIPSLEDLYKEFITRRTDIERLKQLDKMESGLTETVEKCNALQQQVDGLFKENEELVDVLDKEKEKSRELEGNLKETEKQLREANSRILELEMKLRNCQPEEMNEEQEMKEEGEEMEDEKEEKVEKEQQEDEKDNQNEKEQDEHNLTPKSPDGPPLPPRRRSSVAVVGSRAGKALGLHDLIVKRKGERKWLTFEDKIGILAIITGASGEEFEDYIVPFVCECLHQVIPHVQSHRFELVPLIVLMCMKHPTAKSRDAMLKWLLALWSEPNEEERAILVKALISLALNIGSARTEVEILPQIWEQISSANVKRRLLFSELIGSFANYVSPEMCSSLVLSVIKQLSEDSNEQVAVEAVKSLGRVIALIEDVEKYDEIQSFILERIQVGKATFKAHIGEAMCESVVVPFAKWAAGNSRLIGFADEILKILMEEEQVISTWGQGGLDFIVDVISSVLPTIHHAVLLLSTYATSDPPLGWATARDIDIGVFAADFDRYVSLQDENASSWPELDWVACRLLPSVVSLVVEQEDVGTKGKNNNSPLEHLIERVCRLFGSTFSKHVVSPLFEQILDDSSDIARKPFVLRVYLTSVLPIISAEKVAEYVQRVIVMCADGEANWGDHMLATAVVPALRVLIPHIDSYTLFSTLWELVIDTNMVHRTAILTVLKLLVPIVPETYIIERLLPATELLVADLEQSISHAALEMLGQVMGAISDQRAHERINVRLDSVIETGSYEAHIVIIECLKKMIPTSSSQFRSDHIIPKLYQLTCKLPPIASESSDMIISSLISAFTTFNGVEVSRDSIETYILPSLYNMASRTSSRDLSDNIELIALQLQFDEEKDKANDFGGSKKMGKWRRKLASGLKTKNV